LKASVSAHQTVGVETVLSTAKYRKLVRCAHRQGFLVELIYVVLRSPQLNVARVKLRVRKGGHDVSTRKILERRKRSLKQLPWFLANCDAAQIYDNSGAKPRLIGSKKGNIVVLDSGVPHEIREAVEKVRNYSPLRAAHRKR
jgi:predicted ABC-type ATPase